MKRTFVILGLAVLSLALLACVYLVTPLSTRTGTLRVHIEMDRENPEAVGYRAVVETAGLLPVFVGRCEAVSDALEPHAEVLDAVQVWEPGARRWRTESERNHCRPMGLAIVSARFRRNLLWPGQRMNGIWFYPNGVLDWSEQSFKRRQTVRFLLFTHAIDSEPLAGPPFTLQ